MTLRTRSAHRSWMLRLAIAMVALLAVLGVLPLGFGVAPAAQAAMPSITVACASAGGGITVTGRGFVGLPPNKTGSVTLAGYTATFSTSATGFVVSISPVLPLVAGTYQATIALPSLPAIHLSINVPGCGISGGTGGGGGGTATPELGSGELLAAGLLPIVGVLLYRRRSRRAAAIRDDTECG